MKPRTAPHPALRRIVFIAIVLMLILMRREVEITAPELVKGLGHTRLLINHKALAGGFPCCGLLFEFHASCLGDDVSQGLDGVGIADLADQQKLRQTHRSLKPLRMSRMRPYVIVPSQRRSIALFPYPLRRIRASMTFTEA